MDKDILKRLNRVLDDNLGRNPYGEPRYKWAHTRELMYPLARPDERRTNGGLYVTGEHYEMTRQIEEDRWVVAVWEPSPDEETWAAAFKGEVPWPRRGMYYVSDIMLRPGIEPNDQVTNDVLGKVKAKRALTFRDFLDHAEAKAEHMNKETERIQSDYIDDVVTAFGNIPGKRGGSVSFGGV